jgi:hypothetical protein
MTGRVAFLLDPTELFEPSFTVPVSFLPIVRIGRSATRPADSCCQRRSPRSHSIQESIHFDASIHRRNGLEIVSQHQSRHLLQAERLRQSADFPQ